MKQIEKAPEYISRIQMNYHKLHAAEQKLADYLLQRDYSEPLNENVKQLAEKTQVSEATIIRFCKDLGYKGYAEFRLMTKEVGFLPSLGNIELRENMAASEIKSDIGNFVISNIQRCIKLLDNQVLQAAIDAICNTNRLLISGSGAASGLAVTASNTFLNIGIPAMAVSEEMLMLRSVAMMQEGDIFLGISSSGYVKPITDALMVAKQMGATTILITSADRTDTLASQYADYVLNSGTYGVPNVLDMLTTVSLHLVTLQILQMGCVAKKYQHSIEHIQKAEKVVSMARYADTVDSVDISNIN